ncbi:alpha-1-antitrypsin homolog isoform X2 [Clinocottus analis]|uniref:alpha-1-antitrypsin homolog isoform X2 n=1 Tax=Clinocottus analis TaxID=304258 RepID=UPI0035C0B254
MRGIFALSALLLAVACAHPHHQGHDHDHHHGHGHGHDHGTDNAHDHGHKMKCTKLTAPNADFAFALYKSLSAKAAAGKNIFFSPLGISTALAMLSTGAKGETHRQMFSMLGYSAFQQAEVNEAFEHLFHMTDSSQHLDVANAVATRSGFTALQTFLKDVEHFYSAHVFDVNFAKPAEAVAEINRFIANKTHDKITDMVKDLDPDMAMVLINSVYFSGEWLKQFNVNHTKKADFHVDATTKVQVDMMKRTGRYDFYQDADNHTTVILLPYKGNTSMMIVLPDEGKMKEVEANIKKEHIAHWHDSLFRSSVDLFLPKFSISAKASLDSTLAEMGMADAFTDKADFSGITGEVKLKVSKVSHQAMLSVDETGTVAAGVTTIEVMPMSMPETMKVDRPFLAFILEHSTKSILFMGKISNPADV